MRFIKSWLPDEYVEDVYSIDYEDLFRQGYRGLIFDIDNTLVAHGADSNTEIEKLFQKLHSLGFKTLLLSNNSRERVERFNRNINTLFINSAGKPGRECFLKSLQLLGTSKEDTIVIGDTLFTDIRGANRAGLKTVMVKYFGYYSPEPKGIKRYLEKLILSLLKFYGKKKTIL